VQTEDTNVAPTVAPTSVQTEDTNVAPTSVPNRRKQTKVTFSSERKQIIHIYLTIMFHPVTISFLISLSIYIPRS